VLEELAATGTTAGCIDRMIAFSDFNALVGLAKVREAEAFYCADLFEVLQKTNK